MPSVEKFGDGFILAYFTSYPYQVYTIKYDSTYT